MVDPELLAILVCPETRDAVALADPELLRKVNLAVAAGTLTNRSGKRVTEALEEGLVREDGALLYPIRDGIPVMLVDEAIPLGTLG